MNRKILFLFLMIIPNIIISQNIITLSPGVKLGYAFGKNGGFIYGLEVSLVMDDRYEKPNVRYGIVTSLEVLNGERRFHIGGQVNFADELALLGLEIGPTFLIDGKKNDVGISITPYFGGFIIPYFRLNYFNKATTEYEVGTFLKLHVPVQGKYSVGG